MSIQPCIICDKELGPVMRLEDHMPYAGTLFTSYGHYGSTAWDPMDGSYIEITICDECLRNKAKSVLMSRTSRPIKTHCKHGPLRVGNEQVERPLIAWEPEYSSYDEGDDLYVEPEEVGTDMGEHVHWLIEDLPAEWWLEN